MFNFFKTWKSDLPASLVVFLVALPLCLGVALASTGNDARLFSGIIAGVVGGIVVGFVSGSRLGVSGPAAGLITIVLTSIGTLGSFEAFLLAVVLSGLIQIIAGYLKAGVLSSYFPSSVIKGMLAAIGLTLILKEIPHAFGYDSDFMGDEAFFQVDGQNTFTEIFMAMNKVSMGAIIISVLSLLILIIFDRPFLKKSVFSKFIPSALIVVLLGVCINLLFKLYIPSYYLNVKHLVQLPTPKTLVDFVGLFTFPDFSAFTNPKLYVIAFTIAIVGSLETLLSVEATDKLDPDKHHTSTNQELKAQGIGNLVSGLIGGLPVTQVIVRSSANIDSGGKSKLSAILHGVFLLTAVLVIPGVLNLIPLASLAAILLMVGYKLSKISLYKKMYALGWEQFLPFISTIIAVLFTDLLKGIGIGIAVAIFFILKKSYKTNFEIVEKKQSGHSDFEVKLSEEISFLNKGSIAHFLENLPPNSFVVIDGEKCKEIDFDVLEMIEKFVSYTAKERNIICTTINIPRVELFKH
jgi:carbonic anhydrase